MAAAARTSASRTRRKPLSRAANKGPRRPATKEHSGQGRKPRPPTTNGGPGVKTAVTGTRVVRSSRRFAPLPALVIAVVLGYATVVHAAPGDPDTGFDGDGKVATDFADAFNDSGLDVA